MRGLLVVAGVGAALVVGYRRFARCERTCAEADRDAQDLFDRGRPLEALAIIDAADAKCRCARFTSGDSPPQYALADACLRALLREGRGEDVERLLARTRGPILSELAAAGH